MLEVTRGQAPKPYEQVRQLGASEFFAIVFADLGADDEIILQSLHERRVRFPASSNYADAHAFLADNKDAMLSFVSLNDVSFGFTACPDALDIAPSLLLTASGQAEFGIWLFETPVKLASAEALQLAQFVDLESLTVIPGYEPEYRRDWEEDSGTKYPIAELFGALAKRALADEAAKDAANV